MDKPLWPPKVFNLPTALVNNKEVPHATFRFYCKLLSLAWGKDTLRIDLDVLKTATGFKSSALFDHARLLQLHNALLWRCAGSVFECSFTSVSENPRNAEMPLLESLSSDSKNRKGRSKDSQNPRNADRPRKSTTRQITDEYQALLGREVTNWAEGEASAAKEISFDFTPEQLREVYLYYKDQKYWSDKRLPLRYIKNNIADYFEAKKNGKLNGPSAQGRGQQTSAPEPKGFAGMRDYLERQEKHGND